MSDTDQDNTPHEMSAFDWKQLCGAAGENTCFVLNELWTPDNYQNKSDFSHNASWSGTISWESKEATGQICIVAFIRIYQCSTEK